MNALEFARMQFGITTLFHFIFVPLSIGLAFFVALCHTRYYRTGEERWRMATRFWGKLMLISFAIGVVTGIVQEFQFGMNWSDYSRYVGDVFGAPLAMEGLMAFFLESTFIGLWIFGWGRLKPKVHLATAWLVSIGTMLSAYFILAANSWMQHPVGYEFNQVTGRAEMTNIFDVLTNSTALYAIPHTIFGALATGAMVVAGISAYHLLRKRDVEVFKPSIAMALPIVLVATIVTAGVGHFQGVLLEKQQPMKMAAAEALWETDSGVGLSVFALSHFEQNPGHTNVNVQIPKLLSLISTNNPNGTVRGMDDVQEEYRAKYGPGDYVPFVAVTYWSFRAMIGAGVAMILLSLFGLLLARKDRLLDTRWYLKLLPFAAVLPFISNLTGWVFTELGRQPWVVQGLLKTSDAVSPSVSSGEVLLTMVGYTLLYGVLAIVGGVLFMRTVKSGPAAHESETEAPGTDHLAIAY